MTQEFESLSRTMASNAGWQGLRVQVLPYPLEARPDEEVRQIARESYPELLAALGVCH
ncbi:MAG: hypothetical protein GY910_11015 [bacterium]|nr:hypothetical protein [bacterium]